jgi:hypothetical protein
MPADVTEPDLAAKLADRLAHSEQYLAEALKAMQQAIELLPDEDDDEEAA